MPGARAARCSRSGSPFAPVTHAGVTRVPGQCNNAYIFPGVGLGLVASRARRVTDAMFLAAAKCLAAQVGEDDLALGRVYPPLARIREVSVLIAREVAEIAWEQRPGGTRAPRRSAGGHPGADVHAPISRLCLTWIRCGFVRVRLQPRRLPCMVRLQPNVWRTFGFSRTSA